jgi:hypothetical protein
MMSRFILIGMIVGLLLAACASLTPSTAETPQPTPTARLKTWSLHMVHSGGIMGLMRLVDITSDGQMTVTDQRTNKTVTVELTRDELSELRTRVAQASYAAPKIPMSCADCFIFEVALERDSGGPLTATVDETNLADSGLATLINFVRGLMEKALKS